jgi:hypothetical protein
VPRAQTHWVPQVLTSLSLLALSCGKDDGATATTPPPTRLTVVKADATSPGSVQLAVQACAGLYNRKQGGTVFVNRDAHDEVWIDELALAPNETVSESEFMDRCVSDFPTCVRYDYKAQQALLPNVLTVASVLGAVPIADGMTLACKDAAFDAKEVFADKTTPYLATQYVFEQYAKETSGLAMLSPGYDEHPSDSAHPDLTTDMLPALVDFVFSQKLFVVYLVNACITDDPERELLGTIVNAGNWPTPLGVYGYNSTWNVLGGDLYEAQTRCLDSRNMGAIASVTANLSFFSSAKPPIVEAGVVQQNALEAIEYDPSQTYAAFLAGDGDNIAFMMTTRHDWFRQRLDECAKAEGNCPPLTWTISPHLALIAPDLLRWYYERSHETGKDYFALPPSGHLYAYPTSLAEQEQDRFVAATEEDARILGITGTVHWDWFDSWHDAEEHFLPKYATASGAIRGVFPVNVPYKVKTFTWWPKEQFFEVLTGADGGRVVVFRPREWRGVDDDQDPFFQSPQKMADELGSHPRGTVTWVYMTSDGGLTLDNSFMAMAKLLPAHVQLVSADTAVKLALASGKLPSGPAHRSLWRARGGRSAVRLGRFEDERIREAVRRRARASLPRNRRRRRARLARGRAGAAAHHDGPHERREADHAAHLPEGRR